MIKIRCSSLSKIMPEPKTKAEGVLSVGAKTYLKDLAKQIVYDYTDCFSSKETEKGNRCENDSIALYNLVFLTDAIKNTERRTDDFLTGECDIILPHKGVDTKTSWSIATFPALSEDCDKTEYEWQARGYMRLWNVPEWEVAFCLVNTPDDLIRYEPVHLHSVGHIPPHMRVTVVSYERDMVKEARMIEKVKAAQVYVMECIAKIKREHGDYE